ncbi:MAG: hypothetical protein EOM23_05915 [Candidatus Moranbacteria bacterium]|nr:hypothetical protein [Candidatus Moranbacteria bacterium]
MYQTFVVTDLTGQRVRFGEINQSVPVPITRDPNRPCTVKVANEYCADFIDAVRDQGWSHRLITE